MIAVPMKLVFSSLALQFVAALFIPHDFSSISEVGLVDRPDLADPITSPTLLDLEGKSPTLSLQESGERDEIGNFETKSRLGMRPASSQDTLEDPQSGLHTLENSDEYESGFEAPDPYMPPNKVIVVFQDDTTAQQIAEHMELFFDISAAHARLRVHETEYKVEHVFNTVFKGYTATMSPFVVNKLLVLPEVSFIEYDQKWTLDELSVDRNLHNVTEEGAPWGISRMSQRDILEPGMLNDYIYDDEGGQDVNAYVIDTGIYTKHDDFGGRAYRGITIPLGADDEDNIGHGSFCAGIIAGDRYGVAKRAHIIGVKVIDETSGYISDVIAGIEWTILSHRQEMKRNKKLKGSTVNISLYGLKFPILELAVNAAIDAGLHVAVIAGNSNRNACDTSPAGASGPITVGATGIFDERGSFSNYGTCVDIFAPGVNITSVGTSSPNSTLVASGTSAAAPHVCGLLTYFLSLQPNTDSEYATRGPVTPKELKEAIVAFGSQGMISDLDPESPNILAYNGGGKNLSSFWSLGRTRMDIGFDGSF